MEPYRAYGRGSYNRNMNSGCNQMQNMNNRNMCNQNRTSCNQERQSCMQEKNDCMQEKKSCSQERIMQHDHHHHHGNYMMNQADNYKENIMMSMMNSKDCGCQDNCQDSNIHMRHFQLGMGYVPMQEWGDLYDLEAGYCQGTIFPDLNFVFCGARGKK